MSGIVKHIRTGVPYEYLGNNRYRNLCTLAEGEVDEDKAQQLFLISMDGTIMLDHYPLLKELIKKIKLKFDVVSVQK